MPEQKKQLIRGLTLTDTTSLVIGTVIGTGVFIKAAAMAQNVGTPKLVLLAWVAAGFLSLAGALTYAELGAMLPHAGGEYVYLRQSYGDLAAFLFGWMRFVAGSSGSIAIIATGFAVFLSGVFPLTTVWAARKFDLLGQTINWQFGTRQLVAVGVILLFSAINCFGVIFGGRVQTLLTVLKLGGIGVVILGVFFFSHTADWSHLASAANAPAWSGFSLFGVAMLSALWAYDGWNNMPMVAGEVKDPGRNVPRALIFGMIVVMIIYCSANLVYFYALPFNEVVTANSTQYRDAPFVAAKAVETFLGTGSKFIYIAFILSAVGALNGSILTGARVPYAMARDGLFFAKVGELNEGARVPAASIAIQAVWASVLALSGTFDQLSDYVMFASWIFYGLVTSSVFLLRRKLPHAARPYRTIGYPVMPFVFVLVAAWLVVNTLLTKRVESLAGVALISLGLPLYFYFRSTRRAAGTAGETGV